MICVIAALELIEPADPVEIATEISGVVSVAARASSCGDRSAYLRNDHNSKCLEERQ